MKMAAAEYPEDGGRDVIISVARDSTYCWSHDCVNNQLKAN